MPACADTGCEEFSKLKGIILGEIEEAVKMQDMFQSLNRDNPSDYFMTKAVQQSALASKLQSILNQVEKV